MTTIRLEFAGMDTNDIWERHAHDYFVDGSEKNDSSRNEKGIENFSRNESPSDVSSESKADYDGSTQCDTASSPDLDYIDQNKADEKERLETELSRLIDMLQSSFGRHAHCTEDIYVMMKFAQLAKVPRITRGYAQVVLATLKLLHLSKYPASDIWIVIAHASAYFGDLCKAVGPRLGEVERNFLIVPTVFLAHSYIVDITVPLSEWHRHLMGRYCSLKMLNAALLEILKKRRYMLRLDDTELAERLTFITPVPCPRN